MENLTLSGLLMGKLLPKTEQSELPSFLQAPEKPTPEALLLGAGTPAPEPPKPELLNWLNSAALEDIVPESTIPTEVRDEMSQWVSASAKQKNPLPSGTLPGVASAVLPAHLPTFSSALISLVGALRRDLEDHSSRLLQLNPTRREAILLHLERLAGNPTPSGPRDPVATLRGWLEGSTRTPSQRAALHAYFEEVAMLTLGQAMILKSWSDRGLRRWSLEDMGRLNWALTDALSAHLPLDREGWQLTQRNLYSWYFPNSALQREIWETLEGWRISDEGPGLLSGLFRNARSVSPELPSQPEAKSYDPRFFNLLWEQMPRFGLELNEDLQRTQAFRRKRLAFSPTLRDGSLVRTAPVSLHWTGLECNPFLLFCAEMIQLWWGPSAPPLWSIGNGLEVHSRDQLQLQLGAMRPSLNSKIAEIEACDLSFVLEERTTRLNHRTPEAQRLREQLESLPYYKRLRGPASSLGDLQACVAMGKLRPGGLLWWAREEALSESDGTDVLAFLLDRGKLIAEWNFSGIDHHLPAVAPLFPKFLYLFEREPDVTRRHAHRPLRVHVRGQLRSHVEVPLLLQDSLASAATASRTPGAPTSLSKGQWQIQIHQSPTLQKEWAERWPDATAQDSLRRLDRLRQLSSPLAGFCTIRPTPPGDPLRGGVWNLKIQPDLKGLWIRPAHLAAGAASPRRLVASELPRPETGNTGAGWLLFFQDEAWIAPLAEYLGSETVRDWLEHYAERRGNHWNLHEQLVKYIPIPRALLRAMGVQEIGNESMPALPLPGEWERVASELPFSPRTVRSRIGELERHPQGTEIRASLFVRASRVLQHLRSSQGKLLSLVSATGMIRWKELLEILPKTEFTSVPTHPLIRLSGSLPPHIPVGRFERVRTPAPGILLMTDSGFNLLIGSESSVILDMLMHQLEGIEHPTWSELVQYLRLPRRLDLAEQAASEVLRSHGEQSDRLQQLQEFLHECQWA